MWLSRALRMFTIGEVPPLLPVPLFDRRKTASQAHGPNREWPVRSRSWRKVTGITLHQTACVLGERPERWDSVGAHLGITRAGRIMWLHDFDRIVAHGNGFNAQCVGIEIDGIYAGIEGDERTVWHGPAQTLTADAVLAASHAIRWICSAVESHGGKVGALVAHRQSSASRQSDPGEAIWKAVALPMSAELGLTDGGPGFKIGDGAPVPEQWDPRRRGFRY